MPIKLDLQLQNHFWIINNIFSFIYLKNLILDSLMKPRLLPIIKPIYDLVAKTDIPNIMSRLILLKNNTLVLLNENETCQEKLEQFNNTDHSNMINPNLHFYKSFNTFLFINPVLQDVGLLYIVKKEEVNMDSIKKLALQNFQKDLLEQEVIFDSSTDDFDLYQPIMYLFVNNNLKMSKGKTCGQVGHAVGVLVEELMKNPTQEFIDW